MPVDKVFLVIAVVLFLVSAFWNPPRVSLISLGLASLALAFLL